MTNDPKDDIALEDLFKTARAAEPTLDQALVARLLPKADGPPSAVVQPAQRFSFRDWIPAIGGLGMATALGVWIGVAVPIDALLNFGSTATPEALDLSAFYAGADLGVFFNDETGL